MNYSTQQPFHTSRRAVLKSAMAGFGTLATNGPMMSTLLGLQAMNAAVADNGATDYKAIVCVFLGGGNDSFNMLVPTGGDDTTGEFGDYVSSRGGIGSGGLALQQASLLDLNEDSENAPGRSFGLHPAMGEQQSAGNANHNKGVAGLFNDGKASFVTNMGMLSQPLTRQMYSNSKNRPLRLFSHKHQRRQWMDASPRTGQSASLPGWGGNLADLFQSTNMHPSISMNISLQGDGKFIRGRDVLPYAIGAGGATPVGIYNPNGDVQSKIFAQQFDDVFSQSYGNLMARTFAQSSGPALSAAIDFNNAADNVTIDTPFATDSLSKRMKMVAKTIKIAPQLGQTRQIFYVVSGGWDHHGGLLNKHNKSLKPLSRALRSFHDAMEEIGCSDDVVTFTGSEFGRTLSSNGNGSDHGWGGNQIVMGGGIGGGKLFGSYPTSLTTPTHDFTSIGGGSSENINVGRGRMLPTTSLDEFAAELAMWFGVDNKADLRKVLPNIQKFFDFNNDPPPLGLFS